MSIAVDVIVVVDVLGRNGVVDLGATAVLDDMVGSGGSMEETVCCMSVTFHRATSQAGEGGA